MGGMYRSVAFGSIKHHKKKAGVKELPKKHHKHMHGHMVLVPIHNAQAPSPVGQNQHGVV